MLRSLPHPRLQSAFTLVEMMVVVVIIGIMTALIIPEMKGTFQDALLRSSGRDLINVFSLASSRAISLNQLHRVELDPRTGKYLVESRTRNEMPIEFAPLKDVNGSAGQLDNRIVIEVTKLDQVDPETLPRDRVMEDESPEAISFYPDGTADAAQIELRDRAGFRLILRLNPVTSRVQIIEPDQE